MLISNRGGGGRERKKGGRGRVRGTNSWLSASLPDCVEDDFQGFFSMEACWSMFRSHLSMSYRTYIQIHVITCTCTCMYMHTEAQQITWAAHKQTLLHQTLNTIFPSVLPTLELFPHWLSEQNKPCPWIVHTPRAYAIILVGVAQCSIVLSHE